VPRLRWRHQLMRRPGGEQMADLIAERMNRSVPDSRLGTRFLRLLRRAAIPLPVPEFPVRWGPRRHARLDFAYPDLLLYIELDGSHHQQLARLRHDVHRQNSLSALGWRPLRFVHDDLTRRPADVCSEVVLARQASARSVNALESRSRP